MASMENHTLFVHNFTDWDPSNDVPSDTIVEFTAKHITEVWPFDPATGRFRQLGPEAPQAELKHHYIVKKDDIPLSSLLSEKIEQQRGSAELSSRPINLKKVDPECLRIIFASLSREDDRAPMPASVDLDQLVELVNTSNKCKTTKAIRKHLDACAQKFRDDENFLLPGNEKFIWVAYQLGYHSEFHALAKYWQMNASIDDNGEFLLPGGGRLSWDFEWIPHRLLDNILQTGNECLQDILDHVHAKIADLQLDHKCLQPGGGTRDKECCLCQMATVESAFVAAPIDLYHGNKMHAEDIDCSLQEFFDALRAIRMPFLSRIDDEEGNEVQPEHDQCSHETEFRTIIEEAIGRLKSPVDSGHGSHLSQRFKLR